MVSQIASFVAGGVVVAFAPAVGRKIKALFVKESKVAVGELKVDITSGVAAVEKKL